MNRILLAAIAAVTIAAAVPASALSIQMDVPTLNFPPKPAPETTQGCADLTTLKGDVCTFSSE